jgi:hypothetical protein
MVDIFKGHRRAAESTHGGQQSFNHTVMSEYPRPKDSNMLLRLGRIPIEVGLRIMEPIERTIQVINNAGEGSRLFRQHFSKLRLSTCSSSYKAHDYARKGWTTMSEKRSKKVTTSFQSEIIN